MATTAEDALARARGVIEEHGIHTVECGFADTWGHLRGKRIPASHFLRAVAQKGFSMADAAFILGHPLRHLRRAVRESGDRLRRHAGQA